MSAGSKDNLFRFIRSMLRKAEQNPAEWNTPPDNVFEGAMVQLANASGKKRKDRKALFLLLGFSAVLLLVIASLSYYLTGLNQKIHDLESTVSRIQSDDQIQKRQGSEPINESLSTIAPKRETTATNSAALVANGNGPQTIQPILIESTTTQSRKTESHSDGFHSTELMKKREQEVAAGDNNAEIPTQVSVSSRNRNGQNQDFQRNSEAETVINTTAKGFSDETESITPNSFTSTYEIQDQSRATFDNKISTHSTHHTGINAQSNSRADVYDSHLPGSPRFDKSNSISEIGFLQTMISNSTREKIVIAPPALHETTSAQSRFALALLAEANFSTFSMKNTGSGPPVLTKYDKYYAGPGVSAFLQYDLDVRWSAVLNTSFYGLHNNSQMDDEMVFASSNIVTDANGNLTYSTSSMVETPLGPHNTTLQFRSTGIAAQEGEIMTNKTAIKQSLDVWNTSLGMRYAIIYGSRLNIFGGAGIAFSNVVKSKNSMHTNIYMHDKHIGDMLHEVDGIEKMANSFFTIQIEAGGSYAITPAYQILLRTGYNRSITSLRSANLNNEPTTFLGQFNIGLGVQHRF